jgi:hypothetical protein
MDTIFENLLSANEKLLPSEIQAWMNSMQSSQKTGMAKLSDHSTETVFLFLKHGKWVPFFFTTTGKSRSAPSADQFAFQGEVSVNFIPLSPYGLVHSNLLLHIDQHSQESSQQMLENPGVIHPSAVRNNPYLVKIQWKDAAASILFNGNSTPPHSLFISKTTIRDELGISEPIIRLQNDPSGIVTVYSPREGVDAWNELHLRKAFEQLYNNMLGRIELLTGRAIIDSFTRIMSAFAGEQGLDISIQNRQWVNHELFFSTSMAASRYKAILSELLEHFSAVIGPRLLASNLREVFIALPNEARDVLTTHTILPEGYLL